MLGALVLGLSVLAWLRFSQEAQVITDPARGGPDFVAQGEYEGATSDGSAVGAEVIARGGGRFQVNFLPGGLRGAGGDGDKQVEGSGTRADTLIAVSSLGGAWSGRILPLAQMMGKDDQGPELTLHKVTRRSPTLDRPPPAGALVLFDGTSTAGWTNGRLLHGHLLGHDTASQATFGDHTIHLEFACSFMPRFQGQARSNSGVYVQHRYEVQVLDSFGQSAGVEDCGAIYGLRAPSVNACYPPLQCQTFDIDFRAARFDADGKKMAPAIITVRHNGFLIHDRYELSGPTAGAGLPEDTRPGPLFLQGHGGQVVYRNIWVVEGR